MIDVNSNFENVPESVFKEKIINMLLKLNKGMGNAHSGDEIAYVSAEIWRPLYYRNKTVPFGILYKFYDDAIMGNVLVKKITVQTMLSTMQAFIDKFKELNRVNVAKLVNDTERKQVNAALLSTNSPIAAAACWMIAHRCDGYDIDHLTTRQVCDYIQAGKNPELLLNN